MSHNNKNNNQNNQVTVDVKPEEIKPVNNEETKPKKKKMGFKERVFGFPKRHPRIAKAGKVVLETVGITAIAGAAAVGGGYFGCTLAHKDMETLDIDDYLDKKALAITAKPPVDDVKPDTADDGSEDTTTFD